MKKVVDHLKGFEELMEEIERKDMQLTSERDRQTARIWYDLAEIVRSQYQETYDKQREIDLVECCFPALCSVAEVHGARVELEVDEQIRWGRLKYICTGLILDNTFHRDAEIIEWLGKMADVFELSTSDGYIVLEFVFNLVNKEKIADYSNEIEMKTIELRNSLNGLFS